MDVWWQLYLIGILPAFVAIPYLLGRFTNLDDDDSVPAIMCAFFGAGLWPLLIFGVLPYALFKLGIRRASHDRY